MLTDDIELSDYHRQRRGVVLMCLVVTFCAFVGSLVTYYATKRSDAPDDTHSNPIAWYAPIVPHHFKRTREKFDTIVVLGDMSALGPAEPPVQASWSALLTKLLAEKGQRLMSCREGPSCGVNLAAQLNDVAQLSPTGKIPGRTAVIIQTGADSLIECIATRSCTAENVVTQIAWFINNMTDAASQYFSSGEPEVYVFDYPDGTTGSGYVSAAQLSCSVPFLKTSVSGAVGYFNSFSQMLATSAVQYGFAFMPLRFVLARHGAQRDYVLATTNTLAKTVDVLGAESDGANEHVFSTCLYLAQLGQLFQAQLAYSFLTRSEFTQAF